MARNLDFVSHMPYAPVACSSLISYFYKNPLCLKTMLSSTALYKQAWARSDLQLFASEPLS